MTEQQRDNWAQWARGYGEVLDVIMAEAQVDRTAAAMMYAANCLQGAAREWREVVERNQQDAAVNFDRLNSILNQARGPEPKPWEES